jgi:hypothetical protein
MTFVCCADKNIIQYTPKVIYTLLCNWIVILTNELHSYNLYTKLETRNEITLKVGG